MVHPALAVFWSSTLSCQHQPAAGLIYHRPIIDGQKLLADSLGNRVKTRAGAAGEDEAFHRVANKAVTSWISWRWASSFSLRIFQLMWFVSTKRRAFPKERLLLVWSFHQQTHCF